MQSLPLQNQTRVDLVDDHDEVYELWKARGVYQAVLIHFDQHPDFQWISETEFSLGNNDSVKFGKSDSDRINLFKMLVNARGNWVEVKAMANQIKKNEGQTRTTIGQINSQNLKNKIIELIERNDKDKAGAYRISIK